MERHIQRVLNKVSFLSTAIATLILLLLLLHVPETCIPAKAPKKPHLRFPKSTCDFTARYYLPLHKKNDRLWSSKSWTTKVSSYTRFFTQLYQLGVLKNHSRVLCVSAGAGHEIMALTKMGVEDVTGVELVESLPLVSRADPHNLPFFDGTFDVVITGHLEEALYPLQCAGEMERTVRKGGVIVVAVEECNEKEVKDILRLFRRSRLLHYSHVTFKGRRVTRIVMKNKVSA
ncbi:putative Gibberellin 20 oxidase [Hibiscus syriacus]|uniref:Gibberellin 20 oxidase n=1 Tax=Hibiscus syriacus TaxID=106335 RepID=A0A6A3C936_HIBSY|nr:putative Gibberellin 20 oxidase [Hibiscus syriacus]